MEGFFGELKRWREENPDHEKRFEQITRSIKDPSAVTYQPITLPYVEIKTTESTPAITL